MKSSDMLQYIIYCNLKKPKSRVRKCATLHTTHFHDFGATDVSNLCQVKVDTFYDIITLYGNQQQRFFQEKYFAKQ